MVKVSGVSKSFKNINVLKNISFEVGKGEVLGLLGENGAGKSTLLGIIGTLIGPDSGEVFINGLEISSNQRAARRITGNLFGSQPGLYEKMTAKENLEFFGRLSGVEKEALGERIDYLARAFSFGGYAERPVGELSKGMKQKVDIARALIHEPEVLLLDEPESGLDFKACKTVLDFMENCKKEGKSIIFSSHNLENLKNYSDRIAVLDGGEIKHIFSVKEYREKFTERQINELILSWVSKEGNEVG